MNNERFSKYLKRILRSGYRTTPIITFFATLAIAITISLISIFRRDQAHLYVIGLSIMVVSFTLFMVNLDRQTEKRRLSDIMGVKNYDYDTDYVDLEWVIFDTEGKNAILRKRKKIRALEKMAFVKEYAWGDGNIPRIENIKTGDNRLFQIDKEGSKHVLYIAFDHILYPGDLIDIEYERQISNGFTKKNEFVETIITTKTELLNMAIVFPRKRNFKSIIAIHRHGDFSKTYSLGENNFDTSEVENKKRVNWKIMKPDVRDTYIIEWSW